MSQRDLADAAGVSQGVIANIETGAPRVKQTPSVATLVRLALVLGVPPVQLLYPDLPDGTVEAWPGAEVTSIAALQWFSGERTAQDTHIPAPISSNETVWMAREYVRTAAAMRQASTNRAELSMLVDPEWTDEQRELHTARETLAEQVLQLAIQQFIAAKLRIAGADGTVNNGNLPDGQQFAEDLAQRVNHAEQDLMLRVRQARQVGQ